MKNEEIKKVPYIVFEAERHRYRIIIRILSVILAIVLIFAIASNAVWNIRFDNAAKEQTEIKVHTGDFEPIFECGTVPVNGKRKKYYA